MSGIVAQETQEAQEAQEAQNTASKVKWTTAETNKLIDHVHKHCSQHTDGGTFKDATYNVAAAHLRPFLECGRAKDSKSVRYKWGQIRGCQGVYWDSDRGANIKSPAAALVFNTFIGYLEKIEEIFPKGGITGAHAFYPAYVLLVLPTTGCKGNQESNADDNHSSVPRNLDSITATLGSGPDNFNINPYLIDSHLVSHAVAPTAAAINKVKYGSLEGSNLVLNTRLGRLGLSLNYFYYAVEVSKQ
ncbi:hypothetical protein V8B97DRAFT_1915830 [Scleroderma yunnanense]